MKYNFITDILKDSKNIFLAILLLILAACSGHQDMVDKKIKALKNNTLNKDYYKDFELKDSDKDSLLYAEELGRVAFITSDTDRSIEAFNKVIRFYNIKDEQSKIGTLTSGAAASTFANDNVMPYDGADYERVFANFYQALNYIKLKQYDKSMVAIRATSDAQRLAIAKREQEMSKQEASLSKYQFSSDVNAALREANKLRASSNSRFLNAYVYYISGNIRELNGDINGALVDYKNALALYPNNRHILQDTLRLSNGYDNSYYQTTKRSAGISYDEISNIEYKNSKTILVIYEQGFVPQKQETGATVVLMGIIAKFAMPVYKEKQDSLNNVQVYVKESGNSVAFSNAEEINNIYTMAQNDLAEKYNAILTRAITRLTTKVASQVALQSQDNTGLAVAGILLGAATAVTENADLRSFSTLPSYVQVAKLNTTKNFSDVSLLIRGKEVNFEGLSLQNGDIAIIHVVDTGNALYNNVLYKGRK
jgi:hypothetical protein